MSNTFPNESVSPGRPGIAHCSLPSDHCTHLRSEAELLRAKHLLLASCFFLVFAFSVRTASAQKITRGIVVDSLTLKALPGVHIIVKSSGHGTVTNSLGAFTVTTSPADTLVLSMVGYRTLELPLLFE